jgi:hypothetical protein
VDLPWARLELLGLVALVAVSGLAALLLLGGDRAAVRAPDVTTLPYAEGRLTEVADDRLVLRTFRPVDGRRELTFTVRDEDAAFVDVAHLRLHAKQGLATRIWFERSGDTYVAREDADAPPR